MEILSYIFSIISIAFYAIVYVPEFYLIYKTKTSEGLSVWMIILWNQGDILSLIGTILLQLNTNLIIIGWFHYIIGILMTLTVLYYKPKEDDIKNIKTNISIILFLFINFVAIMCVTLYINTEEVVAGEIIGWMATFIYIVGRFLQMYLNYKNKSTKGLSMLLYVFCIFGNLFYFASVISYSTESEYIRINTPWIVLVFVLVFLDLFVILQSRIYKKKVTAITV